VEPSDAELAAATRSGDMRALAGLYHRYAQTLMAVAYRLLQSREDAEDVLHDVFVGLPEALRKYDERGRLEPWLKRVTARVALSRLRSERFVQEIDHQVAARAGGPSAEERITLDNAVAALSPSLRTVLVLKEIEGFSHAEIAGMLGISKGASEVRLHRAVAALKGMVTKDRGKR
jgi:RNA polymerase sigma-70 factor (ECF subfamily)